MKNVPFSMKTKSLPLSLLIATLLSVSASAQSTPPPQSADSKNTSGDTEYVTGKNLLHGRGCEKNPALALEHFKKAADLGIVEAPAAIGYFYAAGLVVEKNDAIAAEWFQKGSEKGSGIAKFNLGRFRLDGKGGITSDEEGVALMEEAAKLGVPEAHTILADIYFLGEHVQNRDYSKAAPHVKAVAATGNINGINMLGVMMQQGLGMERDEKGAEECFRRAAMEGDSKGQSNLGQILNPTSENPARRIEATAWLIIAASQLDPLATRKISELEQTMPRKEFNAARDKADEFQKKISETRNKIPNSP